MIKKNRHRAGRKKREKILRAQLRALLGEKHTKALRPIFRVDPQIREPIIQQPNPSVSLIDLTNDTEQANLDNIINDVPLLNHFHQSDDEVEFLEEILIINQELEPLDPDVEFQHNVTQLFIDLEAYARSIFEITE